MNASSEDSSERNTYIDALRRDLKESGIGEKFRFSGGEELSHRAFVAQVAAEQGRARAAGILAIVVGPALTAVLIRFVGLPPLLSILAGVALGVLVCLLAIAIAHGLRWPAPKETERPPR